MLLNLKSNLNIMSGELIIFVILGGLRFRNRLCVNIVILSWYLFFCKIVDYFFVRLCDVIMV